MFNSWTIKKPSSLLIARTRNIITIIGLSQTQITSREVHLTMEEFTGKFLKEISQNASTTKASSNLLIAIIIISNLNFITNFRILSFVRCFGVNGCNIYSDGRDNSADSIVIIGLLDSRIAILTHLIKITDLFCRNN